MRYNSNYIGYLILSTGKPLFIVDAYKGGYTSAVDAAGGIRRMLTALYHDGGQEVIETGVLPVYEDKGETPREVRQFFDWQGHKIYACDLRQQWGRFETLPADWKRQKVA